jgi:lysophospholipase L1-like esterase
MPLARLFAFALLVLPLFARGADDLPLKPAVECTPRAGLPNFYAKLKAGGEVRIAYLGGSITAQEGWRPKTLAYFQKTYPQAKVSQINAAIGGTGSDLGVFRLKQDVLEKKPDLMFVEFAVNDGGASPEQIYRCMEGIVRQTWKALPDCDICFVYTLTQALSEPMLNGTYTRSASAMEKIADHYGIPSIQMAMEVARLAKEGKLIWKGDLPKTPEAKAELGDKIVFSADSVHPYPETGHELYLAAIVRSLPAIEGASTKTGPHALPAAFIATNYEEAKLVPISEATLSPDFVKLDHKESERGRQFAERLPDIHRANKPGATVTFKFKGTECSIYDIIGPDCGQVSVTVDDKPAKTVVCFDSYCTSWRLARFAVAGDLPPGEHSVKIEILPNQPDKAVILAQRHNVIEKPEKYDDTAFYPGAILLVGELMK